MSGSGARFFPQQLELDDLQGRLAPARLGRMAADADDAAEIDVHLAREQLDPAAAVDEVEERDLPHLAPREHAPGDTERPRVVGRAGLTPSATSRTASISSRSGKRFGSIGQV